MLSATMMFSYFFIMISLKISFYIFLFRLLLVIPFSDINYLTSFLRAVWYFMVRICLQFSDKHLGSYILGHIFGDLFNINGLRTFWRANTAVKSQRPVTKFWTPGVGDLLCGLPVTNSNRGWPLSLSCRQVFWVPDGGDRWSTVKTSECRDALEPTLSLVFFRGTPLCFLCNSHWAPVLSMACRWSPHDGAHRHRNGDRKMWIKREHAEGLWRSKVLSVREIILEKGRKEYGGMVKVRGAQYGQSLDVGKRR